MPAQKKPCDFANPGCAPGEKCQLWGGGLPKYGDYNGTACAAGHVYATWASATPPAGSVEVLPNPGKIGIFIDAIPCGDLHQPCCGQGPKCKNNNLACNNINLCSCGGNGEVCCAGDVCAGDSVCDVDKKCRCGFLNHNCCAPMNTCAGDLVCNHLDFKCIASCGHRGQLCCDGGSCNAPLTCSGGQCACGAENQRCCPSGSPCNFTLQCSNGFCQQPGMNLCTQCGNELQQCTAKCGADDRCKCLCENSCFGCEQDNHCFPQSCRNRSC